MGWPNCPICKDGVGVGWGGGLVNPIHTQCATNETAALGVGGFSFAGGGGGGGVNRALWLDPPPKRLN